MTDFKALKQLSQDLTLLFVEDDNSLRLQTTRIFSNLFKHVDTAENGKDGLKLYEQFYKDTGSFYDIVVSDIEMPYINGIDLSKSILPQNEHQKIIIMSAYDDKEYVDQLVDIGIDCFMQKPLSTEHLLDTMHKVCVSFDGNTVSNCSLEISHR